MVVCPIINGLLHFVLFGVEVDLGLNQFPTQTDVVILARDGKKIPEVAPPLLT